MATELQHRVDLLENLVRQALSRAGGLSAQTSYSLVYRQGATGPQHANVFATWPALMAAANAIDGPKLISVDASLVGGVATVPAGTWTLQDCTFQSFDVAALPELHFLAGAHIGSTDWWTVGAGLSITNAAPVWTPPNGAVIYVDKGFVGPLVPGAPFFTIGAGVTFAVILFPTGLAGDDSNPCFNLTDATSVLTVVGLGSDSDDQLGQHSCEGVAGSTVNFEHDNNCLARNITVAGQVFNETLLSMAVETEYVAGTPGNWAAPPPANVNIAIDRLAAAVRGLLGSPIP